MNDLSNLYQYMKKYVEIELKSRKDKQVGWVFTIDPISKSYVLVNFDGDKPNEVTMVMGEEVKHVKILPSPADPNLQLLIMQQLETLFSDNDQTDEHGHDFESIKKRREQLIEWFEKNRLPVKVEPVEGSDFPIINILDTVQIRAPYEDQNCESTNEIILDKVRNLVKNLKAK